MITIFTMFIFQLHLDRSRRISYHCLMRNVTIVSGIALIYTKQVPAQYVIACILCIEVIFEILHHYGISLDPYENKVINFYRWADTLWSSPQVQKINTYTEGGYDCDPHMSLDTGNVNKFKWMAEQAKVRANTRVLELGSGNGEFLFYVKTHYGAQPIGICNSEPQVVLNAKRGITVINTDIWSIPQNLHGQFDCVILNGSTEHFCTWKNHSEIDTKLEQLFVEISKCLDPKSDNKRVVITAITQHRDFSLYEKWQIYLLERSYGGYYALHPNSYESNARPHGFALVLRENHTDDYYIWARRIWWHVILGLKDPLTFLKMIVDIPVFVLNDPYFIHKILHILFGTWPWQFEPPYLPMLSYNDTPPMQHQWIVLEKVN